jgi:4-amino-4-deoxy-L-arabinose transferase-like glycosyltransferase
VSPARRDRAGLLALGLVALALRLAYRIDHDEDLDALRFRLAVERFDVAALRPHAPFYPVYVGAAKLVAALGAPAHLALGIVSAAAGAVLVVLTALLAFEVLGRRAAWIAGALALASPFLWLSSEKLLSDVPGAAAVALALWLLARARRLPDRAASLRTMALIALGVGLGVRLSYFPFAIVAMVVVARAEGGRGAYLTRARDLAVGVVPWLVPLVILAGARPLVIAAIGQGTGHFTRWGGSALTVTSPVDRLHGIVWGLWANVLGGAWIDAPRARWLGAPLLAILLVAATRRVSLPALRRQPEIVVGALAYFLWATLGQNTAYKPRHWLPLAPLLIVALAAGAEALAARFRAGIAVVALLAAQWITDGAALVAAHRVPSPAAALVAFVAAASDPPPIITLDLAPLLAAGAPGRRVLPAPALADPPPRAAWITGEALSPALLGQLADHGLRARPIFARPRSRYVDSLWSDLALWIIEPITPDK